MGKRRNSFARFGPTFRRKSADRSISGERDLGKMGNMDGKAQTLPDHPTEAARGLEARALPGR
jgi:hypothetical protein